MGACECDCTPFTDRPGGGGLLNDGAWIDTYWICWSRIK